MRGSISARSQETDGFKRISPAFYTTCRTVFRCMDVSAHSAVVLCLILASSTSCNHGGTSHSFRVPSPPESLCSIQQPTTISAPGSAVVPGRLDINDGSEPARWVHVPSAMDAVWFVARQSGPRGVEKLCVSATIERSRHAPTYVRFRSFAEDGEPPLETLLYLDVQGGEVMVRGAEPDRSRHLSFRVVAWIRAQSSDLAMTSPLAEWHRNSMDVSNCGRPSFWIARQDETFLFNNPVQLVGARWSIRLDTWFARRAACLARSREIP